jgi:hypothetical protein
VRAARSRAWPVDFCAEDEGRSVDHLEEINHETVEAFAQCAPDAACVLKLKGNAQT